MPETDNPRKQEVLIPPFRFSLRILLVAFAMLAITLLLYVKFTKSIRQDSLETSLVGGIMQVSPALKNYVNSNESELLPLPITLDRIANPLSSWRLQIIGRVTSPPTDYDLASPWNAAINKPLTTWPCWVYCFKDNSPKKHCETNLFAIAGEGTAFNPKTPIKCSEVDNDVILVMDVADSGIHWMEPGDFDVSELLNCNGSLLDCVKSVIPNRVYVLFADGEIWCLSGETPMERIKPFFTLSGAQNHSRNNELEEYCLKRWSTVGIAKP